MRIAVRRFEPRDADAVDRFNTRLAALGISHRLYVDDRAAVPTADREAPLIEDSLFVACDGTEIRGGAWLREQSFWVGGDRRRVGWMKYPVSESLVDPRFAAVPARMVLAFLKMQPQLMALGMGGRNAPFARLLAGLGWKSSTVPFLFRVVRPHRVLTRLAYVRGRPWLRAGMDIAAWSGAAWAAHRLVLATAHRVAKSSGIAVTTEPRFTPWADPVWEACRGEYRALAVRDARTLDCIYPESFEGLERLKVSRAGSDIGWICAQVLFPSEDRAAYFGDLKVGVLTDMLALGNDAADVLAMGVGHLEERGVDLIIANLSHTAWLEAARRLRFFSGPSTFAFARSAGAEELLMGDGTDALVHLTRSDGDGPIR